MFAGPHSRTAPLNLLPLVDRLKAKGETLSNIWKSTGWLCGPGDARWYEIDDSASTFAVSHVLSRDPYYPSGKRKADWIANAQRGHAFNVPLPHILKHKALYQAYPFLQQMKVSTVIGANVPQAYLGGSFQRAANKETNTKIYQPFRVIARDVEEARSNLFHEIQHYIQDREGQTPGATITPDITFRKGAEPSRKEQFSPDTQAARSPYNPECLIQKQVMDDYWGETYELSAEQCVIKIGELLALLDRETDENKRAELEIGILELRYSVLEAVSITKEDYLDAGAERQARLVQERLSLSASERRQACPVPDNEPLQDLRLMTFDDACRELYRRAAIDVEIEQKWAKPVVLDDDLHAIRQNECEVVIRYKGETIFKAHLYNGAASVEVFLNSTDLRKWKIEPSTLAQASQDEQIQIWQLTKNYLTKRYNTSIEAMGCYTRERDAIWWRSVDRQMVLGNAQAYADEIRAYVARAYGPDYECEIFDDGRNNIEIWKEDDMPVHDEGDGIVTLSVWDIPELVERFPELAYRPDHLNIPAGLDPAIWDNRGLGL